MNQIGSSFRDPHQRAEMPSIKLAFAGIVAPIVAVVLFTCVGCKESVPPSTRDVGSLQQLPVVNDPRATLSPSDLATLGKRFAVAPLRTNDMDGIAIIDLEKSEPIWIEWFFEHEGESRRSAHTLSYCFEGRPIFELYLATNAPPRRSVIYYDTNGLYKAILADRSGVGMFTDRILYGEESARLEWWYDERWHPVVEQDNKRGIMLNGAWTPMELSNGVVVPTSQN